MPETPILVFISYARTNTAFVDRLEADLQARNFRTWVDRHKLEGGQQWLDEIQDAIDRCQVLLVVLSPEAAESRYVRMEYRYARDEHKPVIPLQYRSGPKIPMDLRHVQRIDFEGDYDQGLEILLKALSRIEIPLSTIQEPLLIETQGALNIEASSPNSSDYGTKDKQHNAGFDYRIGLSPSIRPIIPSHEDEEPVLSPEDFNQAQNVRQTTTNMQKSDADIMMRPQAVSSEATRQIRDKSSTPYDPYNPFAYLEDAQSVPLPEQRASVSMDEIADKVPDIADYPVPIDGIHIEDEGDLGDIVDLSDSSSTSWTMPAPDKKQDIPEPSRRYGLRPRTNRTGKVLPPVPPQSLPDPDDMELPPVYDRPTQVSPPSSLKRQSELNPFTGGVSNHSPQPASPFQPRPRNQPRTIQPGQKKRPTSSRPGLGVAGRKRGTQPTALNQSVVKKGKTRHEFIENELGTIPFVVWCCAFALVGGLGSIVSLLSKNVYGALVMVIVAPLLGYRLGYRKAVHPLIMLGIAILGGLAVFYLTQYVSALPSYTTSHSFSFLIFNNRVTWIGRQVNFGLILGIIGTVASVIGGLWYLEFKNTQGLTPCIGVGLPIGAGVGLIAWLIVAVIALIFGGGFGIGPWWYISLLAEAIALLGGVALSIFALVWSL